MKIGTLEIPFPGGWIRIPFVLLFMIFGMLPAYLVSKTLRLLGCHELHDQWIHKTNSIISDIKRSPWILTPGERRNLVQIKDIEGCEDKQEVHFGLEYVGVISRTEDQLYHYLALQPDKSLQTTSVSRVEDRTDCLYAIVQYLTGRTDNEIAKMRTREESYST